MNTRSLERIKDMLCTELEKVADRGEINSSTLGIVHDLTDTIKNIDKIMYIDENGYSMAGDWTATGSYGRGNSFDSYGRDGTHYVHGNYSRNNSYSYADGRDMIRNQVRDMMNNSNLSMSERERLDKVMNEL